MKASHEPQTMHPLSGVTNDPAEQVHLENWLHETVAPRIKAWEDNPTGGKNATDTLAEVLAD